MHHCANVIKHPLQQSAKLPNFIFVKVKYDVSKTMFTGADPGFLERGFICINVLGSLSQDGVYREKTFRSSTLY